jgi:hypothetical protein
MTLEQFFRLVLPDEGVYCFAAIQKPLIEHVFVDTIEELMGIPDAVNGKVNQYFTPFNFKEYGPRTQKNSLRAKCFWLDIDVGKANDRMSYDTADNAVEAINAFIESSGLPEPLRVSTGNGFHLYWVVDQLLESATWKPIAIRLGDLAKELGLKVDTACTSNNAQLMRFPTTLNYRDIDNPKDSCILTDTYEPLSLFEFAATLGIGEKEEETNELGFEIPEHIKYIDEETKRQILGVTIFKNIMERTDTCAQLKHIVEQRATLEEPMWRAGLSIAQICEDREDAIKAVSEDYPGYSYDAAQQKASKTNGPYTCQAFSDLDSDRCNGCPHKGKISTPAQLGKHIPAAQTEEERTVVTTLVAEDTQPIQVKTIIPEYPEPYFRPKGGKGVHKIIKVPGEPDSSVEICEYDFYVTRRMHDPDVGEVLWFSVHLPRDGMREFSVPLADAAARDKLRDALARNGLLATDGKQLNEYVLYVKKWLRHLQMSKQAEKVRAQMGWTDDGTFVVGTKELVPGKIEGEDIAYAPAAVRNANIIPALTEKGDFHKWKEVVNFYRNDQMEAYAFALFLSFGAPLMHFTTLRGGVYNLVSEQSGIGKSSALLAANSIWGHPVDLLLQKDDTYNVRIHRAGVMRHLPITIDEITNMKPLELSDQIYASTTGRGKNRMETHSNNERLNQTSWQTPTLTTSNSSITDKLYATKSFPEGELMRVIEVGVTRNSNFPKAYTDMLFAQLEHNYGMAWLPLMRYYINHQNDVIAMLRATQEKTDSAAHLTQRERIWSAMAAIGITGGTIAHSLGLHDIPVEHIAKWVASTMFDTSKNITQSRNTSEDSIAAYMAENYNNLLMIRNEPEAGQMAVVPLHEPRGELRIRVEPDTRRIFIASGPFKKWCANNQVSYNALIKNLKDTGMRLEAVKKRMAKGTPISMPPTSSIMIQIPANVAGSVFGLDEMDEIDAGKKASTIEALSSDH